MLPPSPHRRRPTRFATVVFAISAAALLPLQAGLTVETPEAPAVERATPPIQHTVAAEPEPAHPGQPTSPEAAEPGTFTWDPTADFLRSPTQANPSPDRYGNPDVWSYLAGPSLDHDPADYVPMPDYVVADDVYEKWTYPHDAYHLIAHLDDPPELQMHTGAGWLSVLAWRSPIDGLVRLEGTVRLRGGECANVATGIIFSVDHGSHIVQRVVLNEPGEASLAAQVEIAAGESLYFILDPGQDTHCDTTLLFLTLTGIGSLPDTSMAPPG